MAEPGPPARSSAIGFVYSNFSRSILSTAVMGTAASPPRNLTVFLDTETDNAFTSCVGDFKKN